MSNVLEWYEKCNAYIENHLDEFLEKFYTSDIIALPNGYRLNPCPICGHNDCATFSNGFVNCFSCGWSGNNVSAYLEYAVEKTPRGKDSAIQQIENFCNVHYPRPGSQKQIEEMQKLRRISDIKSLSIDFYAKQLKVAKTRYELQDGRRMTPIDYLKVIRGHSEETLSSFKVGFSENYYKLKQSLLEEGYTEEEISEAKIWLPTGLIIYPQWHPITKDILRVNTKNPFKVTMDDKEKPGKQVEIKGFSRGEKVMGFSPRFSFKEPIILVEGENDAQSIYEEGGEKARNCSWLAGNPREEQFEIFENAKAPIYLMMDNDEAGEKYIEKINKLIPDKPLFRISYDKSYSDPDDYYKKNPDKKSISELMEKAEALKTEEFRTIHKGQIWTIQNRHKRLEFDMDYIDDKKGLIVGNAKVFVEDVLKDTKNSVSLTKLPQIFKPLSLYLDEEIATYYNAPDGLREKTMKDLLEIFRFSKYKSEIIKAFAFKIFHSEEDMEKQIITLREVIGQDSVDEVLKEINDLQNRDVLDSLTTIPTLKLSHFFSIKNNDAYFYFTAVKYDGDTIRRIPYLLRNDGGLIRLDLLKRKDSQCLLLIDNKYELPEEVSEARMKLSECSLVADWANKFSDGEITDEEVSPYNLLESIEDYVRRFYYHNDDNVYKIITLFIYGTYFYEMFGQYPYLFLNGEKGSGKTILDIVIYMFALNAKLAVNISEAALYRIVALEGGTMILDEIENLTSRSKTQDSLMATLLKGGYQKGGKAYRFNRDLNISEGFEVYSPKVISNIYGVEDVIEDRCIRIDTFRMQVIKGFKMEDPKMYQMERLDEIREITSKCAISALKYFQLLNGIYDKSQMMTNNARLTQLLTPILALARFVDLSKTNPGYKNIDIETLDIEKIEGKYTKAFLGYYKSHITVVKDEVEAGTPEGLIKYILSRVSSELSGVVDEALIEYIDRLSHKYTNEIAYNPDTGDFVIDAIHIKVFMEETLTNWQITLAQVHRWMKSIYETGKSKRKNVKLENCAEELLFEFKGNTKIKVQHYEFNVKDFVTSMNTFTNEDTQEEKTEYKDLEKPF